MIELLITIILSSIPIMMAASGELIVERSGVVCGRLRAERSVASNLSV